MHHLIALLAGAVLAAPVVLSAAEVAGPADIDLSGADIVLIGEVHDNPVHHAAQAELIRGLAPSSVVFEMLDAGQAEVANAARPGADMTELGEALGWEDSGWPAFELYAPVFAAALEAEARIYGAALPRETVRAAFESGPAEVFGPDAERFGLTTPLPGDEQATREAEQMSAHCDALPEDMLPGMVGAQRLRDAAFARVTLVALEETGGPVAVVTGNGHARTDWGMPVPLSRAAPELRVLSVGQLEAEPDAPPPFDVWLVTAAPERGDPCAAFQ